MIGNRTAHLWIAAIMTMISVATTAQEITSHDSIHDKRRAEIFAARDADWRNGPIVYQVIVDRFAPSLDLNAKKHLYPAPKKLRTWDELPKRGTFVEEVQVWSHEIDFWGGDLASLMTKLVYLDQLGVDVLYLNPIQAAYTNHKYDAQDYFDVSKEYGTRADVGRLAQALHARGMKLVMDGVFNHMGRSSPMFIDAMKDEKSQYRDWYFIGSEHKMGYRGWYNVENLPELRLENPMVRARLWGDDDSVIQGYIRNEGIDGWRLDVAFDIGPNALAELTAGAHNARPDTVVIGEIWNYPEEWMPAVDGLMNMHLREIILNTAKGRLSGGRAGQMIDRMVQDTGIEPLLKSWVILDNHDTSRLKTMLTEPWQQQMAQLLQFTAPGSPCVYYGVEVGLEGGEDPEMRGPMRWDRIGPDTPEYVWLNTLTKLRNDNPALRYGDYLVLDSNKLLAFVRRTDKVAETCIVIVNPTDAPVEEMIAVRESKIMSGDLVDRLSGKTVNCASGTMTPLVPAHGFMVLQADPKLPTFEYSSYKRVR